MIPTLIIIWIIYLVLPIKRRRDKKETPEELEEYKKMIDFLAEDAERRPGFVFPQA